MLANPEHVEPGTIGSLDAPVAFPDVVQVGLRVARVGTTSVKYEAGVFRNADPLCAARPR